MNRLIITKNIVKCNNFSVFKFRSKH